MFKLLNSSKKLIFNFGYVSKALVDTIGVSSTHFFSIHSDGCCDGFFFNLKSAICTSEHFQIWIHRKQTTFLIFLMSSKILIINNIFVNKMFINSLTKTCSFDWCIVECMPGYLGPNCTLSCPYPTYGEQCEGHCDCSKPSCDIATGCRAPITGAILYQ